MTDTAATDIADGIMLVIFGVGWNSTPRHDAARDRIASALTAYGDARLEEAAKVADNYRDVMLNTDLQTEPLLWLDGAEHAAHDVAAAIRSLASKEPTP